MGLKMPSLDDMPFVVSGPIPLIKINGMESYWVDDTGWAHSRYFVVEPVIQREPDFSRFRPFIKRLNLELMVPQSAQEAMRGQVAAALRQAGLLGMSAQMFLC